jgi:hypothetical protein
MKIVVPNTIRRYDDMIIESSLDSNEYQFPTWNPAHVYYQGNMAYYEGKLYRSLEYNKNKQPDTYKDDFWYEWGTWNNTTGNVWDSGTTYSVGDLVSYSVPESYKNYMYIATDSSTSEKPSTTPSKWVNIGAINKYRCLYGATENKTEAQISLDITVKTYGANFAYMLGVDGIQASIEVFKSDGTQVGDTDTLSLQYKGASSWSEFLFDEFKYRTTFGASVAYGLTNKVKFTINAYDVARLGNIVVGKSFYVGETLWGASAGILDFSTIERDEQFGDVTLRQGSFANRADVTVYVDTPRADAVKQFLTAIRGTEVLILADDTDNGFDMLKIRGFVRDFDVTLQNQSKTELSLEIEGLI